jgi:hypothetical protein
MLKPNLSLRGVKRRSNLLSRPFLAPFRRRLLRPALRGTRNDICRHVASILGIKDKPMYVDIISARYINDYKIELTFENGKSGVVDFMKFIDKGGIFARLSDPDFFKSFQVNEELGVITWEDEIDVAPETLYSEATGEPLPHWMSEETEIRETAGDSRCVPR